MEKNLEQNNLLRPPRMGEIMEGKIIGVAKKSVFLDLGAWGTGIIYGREFSEAKNTLRDLKIGDSLLVKIIELENEEGYVELSVKEADKEITWENLRKSKEKGELLKVKILGANKGGLLAEVSGIPAFLPVSQLSSENYPKVEDADKSEILKALQKFIGKELKIKIFDLSSGEQKLILSEKAKETEKIKKILKNYKVGDVIEGQITDVVDFGAFIKFLPSDKKTKDKDPELEGLIHISELDWQLIENPSEVVKVGEKVKAKIIDISNNKVSLSLKALKKDPWEKIEKKYKKGDIVKGKVTKFNPFGAFVQISPKIQGLIHISEFGSQEKMAEALEVGKKYDFKILSLDSKEYKISLELIK
ncbi:30S ribosomal protein S1 [Patescibacteria group bacterium]